MSDYYWGIYYHGRNYGLALDELEPFDRFGLERAIENAKRTEDKYAPAQILPVIIRTEAPITNAYYYRGDSHSLGEARADGMLDS